jgi:hypothetical protein
MGAERRWAANMFWIITSFGRLLAATQLARKELADMRNASRRFGRTSRTTDVQSDSMADDLGGNATAVLWVRRWLHAVSVVGFQSGRHTRLP